MFVWPTTGFYAAITRYNYSITNSYKIEEVRNEEEPSSATKVGFSNEKLWLNVRNCEVTVEKTPHLTTENGKLEYRKRSFWRKKLA